MTVIADLVVSLGLESEEASALTAFENDTLPRELFTGLETCIGCL